MRKRSARLACIAVGGGAVGLALSLTSAGPAVTGCTTHQCDQSTYEWPPAHLLPDGGEVPGGFMADKDTYMTNGLDDTWLDFAGNTTIQIWFPPEVAGRTPLPPTVDIGTAPTPNSQAAREAGASYAGAAGQLDSMNTLNTDPVVAPDGGTLYGGGFALTNSSCALYYAHVVVQFVPRDAATETSGAFDGGAGPDAEPDGSD